MKLSDITAVILAGGRGQRMGVKNKGLLHFQGRPLIAHVIERLAIQLPRIVISANNDLATYRQFGLPVIADLIADYPGPLGGIYSVMHSEPSEWLLTVPCDTPFLPMDYVRRMQSAIDSHNAWVAHDGERLQAGFCLLKRTLFPAIEQALQAKHFAVHRFLDSVMAQQVDFSDEKDAFININTPEDLVKFSVYD